MSFCNYIYKYLERYAPMCLQYQICFVAKQSRTDTTENQYEGIIDSGRELALMFNILKDQTSKMNQVS